MAITEAAREDAMSRHESFALRTIVVAVAVLAIAAAPEAAQGHRDTRVGLCIPYYKGGPCVKGKVAASYKYGEDVPIKGRVRPEHRGTIRIKRRKGSNPWRVVATPRLDADGRYRYVWHTRRRNADQGEPYRFKAVLRGHDVSPIRRVAVLFEE